MERERLPYCLRCFKLKCGHSWHFEGGTPLDAEDTPCEQHREIGPEFAQTTIEMRLHPDTARVFEEIQRKYAPLYDVRRRELDEEMSRLWTTP